MMDFIANCFFQANPSADKSSPLPVLAQQEHTWQFNMLWVNLN